MDWSFLQWSLEGREEEYDDLLPLPQVAGWGAFERNLHRGLSTLG